MITIILILTILASVMPWNKNAASAQWLTRLSSIVIIFSSFLIMNIFYGDRLQDGLSIYSGFLSLNNLNQTFQILILFTGGLIVASIVNFNSLPSGYGSPDQNYLRNYSFIILFNLIGASVLCCAGDLLTLYITVEIQSFSLYILSTLKNDSAKSASAGLKYFLIGSLASTLILLGIALFYYATGLTNFESIFVYYSITDWFSMDGFTAGLMEPASPYDHTIGIWNFAEMNSYYSVGIFAFILIITGVFIKVGAAPFHQWSVDVYSLVPTAVTTWLVILPKIALFVLLYQLLELVLETGNAMLYSSANNSIIDWMLDSAVQNHIGDLIKNHTFNIAYVTDWLNNFYYDQLISNIQNIYGDSTHFYPHFLQIELLNTINSPIVNESSYNFVSVPFGEIELENKDFLNNIWSDYSSEMHNSLYYTFNITPIGALTIKNLLILISMTSLIIGAIGGLFQLNIKRLLAFSAISHVGFLLLALAINNKVSLESFIFYLGQYTLTNLNIFLILITFGYLSSFSFSSKVLINSPTSLHLSPLGQNHQSLIITPVPGQIGSFDLNFITQLTGLFTNNPILTMSFAISLFSMAGIPPMIGFFAKQQVLLSSLSFGFIFVTIIAITSSVVSAYYYLKLIQVSTFSNNNLLSRLWAGLKINNFLNKNGNKNLFEFIVLKESAQPISLPTVLKEGAKLITDKNNIFYFEPNLSAKANYVEQNGFFTSTQYGIYKFDPNFFIRSYTPSSKNNTKFISSMFITNSIHSYLISIFTLIILFYTLKPVLLLNLTSILASYSFNL
jgi:NADH:ubiquinone oxidoreductase subunit 2 (subunit N)